MRSKKISDAHGGKMTKATAERIEKMARANDLKDYKWIQPSSIITGHWVRAKCMYGCPRYGQKACCPPEVPSVAECVNFFREYKSGIFFHFARKFKKPKTRFSWYREINKKVLDLEKEVFLSGFYKAFALPPATCSLCAQCKESKPECRQPLASRPTLEAFCVDVYATARKMEYPIQVLKSYQEEMNRFGLLLIE
jgi:predicted metal-binding protein